MSQLQISGTLYKKYESKMVGKNKDFEVREFILKVDGMYPTHPTIQVVKDNCRELENYDVGSPMTCQINIKGNLYQDKKTGEEKSFTSIEAWKIEHTAIQTDGSIESEARNVTDKAGATVVEDDDSDGLPF